jgi:hypothetical protein
MAGRRRARTRIPGITVSYGGGEEEEEELTVLGWEEEEEPVTEHGILR